MDCDLILNGIPRDCYGSIGGLSQLWLGDRSQVTPVEDTTEEAPILSAINVAEGVTTPVVKRYWFKTENANFVTSMSTNGAFITSLTAIFEKLSADKNREWEELKKDGAFGLVRDNNGKWWFLGFTNPLVLDRDSSQAETGSARDEDNQYTFVLTDYSTRPLFEVPTAVAEGLISGTAPASRAIAGVNDKTKKEN